MNTTCPNGHPNRFGAKFCSVCGARIPAVNAAPAAPMSYPQTPVSYPDAVVPLAPSAPSAGPIRFPLGLIPTLSGVLIVLAGFFMDWLVIGSPMGSFFTVMNENQTLSGYRLLMAAPTSFQSYPTVGIVVIPGLAVEALLITVLTAVRVIPLRWLLSGVQFLLAVGGVIAMFMVLGTARSQAEQLLKSYEFLEPLSQLLSKAVVNIDPGLGLYATAFGFVLISLGAFVDFMTQLIWP